MKKRIAIIGRGTAGSQAVIHYLNHMPDCEIQWYFDSNRAPQSVGEGSTLTLPINLFQNINFSYSDLDKIDSTVKLGIYKSNWGKTNKNFFHQFPPPGIGLHFNATSLQNYILDLVKDKVYIFEKNTSEINIDADYIMDCSGKPEEYDKFNKSEYIPVNSAYITQCYWEYPKFQYTLTIARPYGWVFGIPLRNRCSIGYIYNKNINTLDEIKEDVKQIFKKYDLIPSDDTNSINFENYYRKQNYDYDGRIVYNGNSSFFLEPLEATSISVMDFIQRSTLKIWKNSECPEIHNLKYKKFLFEIEVIIMMHYFSGSKYDTEFWRYAQNRGKECLEKKIKNDLSLSNMISYAISRKHYNNCDNSEGYGVWPPGSFCENIFGLGIDEELSKMIRDI